MKLFLNLTISSNEENEGDVPVFLNYSNIGERAIWLADFKNGIIVRANWYDGYKPDNSANAIPRIEVNIENYVRAVCTLKNAP